MEYPKTSRLYYGWFVLAASFLILFFNSGARYSFGVLFKPMVADLGWNRGPISFAFFLNMTLFALSNVVVGKFYDRYGPKWVIIISTLLISAGYSLISVTSSLWEFYVYYGVLAAIGTGGVSIPLMSVLISKWFDKWRGLAISLTLSGSCLGHFVMIPAITAFTLHLGWRSSYFAMGLVMFIVNLSVVLLVIGRKTEPLSQNVMTPGGTIGDRDRVALKSRSEGLSFKEAARTSSFWLFAAVMFICGSGDFLVSTHLIPFATDQGISPVVAGNMLAWLGFTSLLGVLIAGPASDLVGNKIPLALTFLLRLASYILILKYQSLTSFYVFSLVFGLTFMTIAPLSATLIGRIYGFSNIGLLAGFVNTLHHLGGGLWAYLGGWAFDRTGSYHLIFSASAVLAAVAVICSILISEKPHQRIEASV
jgi:MFS family permease